MQVNFYYIKDIIQTFYLFKNKKAFFKHFLLNLKKTLVILIHDFKIKYFRSKKGH
jgi:hypothetical protein